MVAKFFAGKRPDSLGVKGNQLAGCPDSPNCVCSHLSSMDKVHSIDPISYNSSAAEAIAKIKTIVQAMPKTQIITETDNYLYAEFTSQLMGFVDDVEFLVYDNPKVIHVRSASRLGRSDLGVNRKRIEEIRSQFNR
ncbi:MAG: DUF1499 domain-containing protein [Desertifilum sp.]|nr:DUF1499 domain-containing protein [Desertifilum sp.]